MRPRALRGGLVALVLVLVGTGPGALTSLAAFTDTALASGSLEADTLAPPTGLVATGGATVGLTWTPTVDIYASGYELWRGSTTGGPYVSIATVTPGTAGSTTDAPTDGTWFYVLRSVAGAWRSLDSNEASAMVTTAPPISTAYAGCTDQAADTTGAGDNNGFQTQPARACASDNLDAADPATGTTAGSSCGTGAVPNPAKDRHRFWGFATGLPGSVSVITGIEVRADTGMNNNAGTTVLCAQLSWDGGTSWTDLQSVALSGPQESTYLLGGTTDTWGRSWTLAELTPTSFRVRLVPASSRTDKRIDLDYLAVSVSYQP